METEDVVQIRCQVTPSEDREDVMRAIVICKVCELALQL
jgi:hypothetical protein